MKNSWIVRLALAGSIFALVAVAAVIRTSPRDSTAQPVETGKCALNQAVSDLTNDLPPDACVTAIDSSPDGDLALGTEDGRIGFVSGSGLTISDVEGTSGPIEAIFLDVVEGDQGTARFGVAFLSPEGIGAFSVEKQQRVSFQVDVKPSSQAAEFAANLLNDGLVTLPVTLTADGLARDSNGMRVLPFVMSTGSECLRHERPGGVRSVVLWCTPSSSMFHFEIPTITIPADSVPFCGGPDIPVSPENELSITASRDGFDKDSFTLEAGQYYRMTVTNTDELTYHRWSVRSLDGKRFIACDKGSVGPATTSVVFSIDEPGRYEFSDEIPTPGFAGTLIVE